MEPLLIAEGLVTQFNFWMNDQMQQGMRFRDELYRHAARFDRQHRYQAFEAASYLMLEGTEAIVTAGKDHYTIWVCLRSPATPAAELPPTVSINQRQTASLLPELVPA